MRGGATRAALAAALAAGLACGRKAAPVAPELVVPEPPEELAAVATPDGIRLTWLRPTRYSGGQRMNDLGGFVIERAPGEGTAPEFRAIGTLTLDDRFRFRKERRLEWLDRDVAPGARYLYRVTALTLDRSRSPAAGPIAIRFGPPPGPTEEPARPAPRETP
jgi:hypothetical protein